MHLECAGLFWLQAGQTDTVYGAQNSNGLLFFLMMFVAMRVSFFQSRTKLIWRQWKLMVVCKFQKFAFVALTLTNTDTQIWEQSTPFWAALFCTFQHQKLVLFIPVEESSSAPIIIPRSTRTNEIWSWTEQGHMACKQRWCLRVCNSVVCVFIGVRLPNSHESRNAWAKLRKYFLCSPCSQPCSSFHLSSKWFWKSVLLECTKFLHTTWQELAQVKFPSLFLCLYLCPCITS